MDRLKHATLDATWFSMETPVTLSPPGAPIGKETNTRSGRLYSKAKTFVKEIMWIILFQEWTVYSTLAEHFFHLEKNFCFHY